MKNEKETKTVTITADKMMKDLAAGMSMAKLSELNEISQMMTIQYINNHIPANKVLENIRDMIYKKTDILNKIVVAHSEKEKEENKEKPIKAAN